MEAKVLDIAGFGGPENFVELKVRSKEFNYDYYQFPRHVIEKTIDCLKRSDVYCDEVSADSEEIHNLPLVESKYSTDKYDEEECLAVNFSVDINEIYEVIDYIEKHPNERVTVVLYKNSELPEYADLLSYKAKNECSTDIQAVLNSYMKLLIDMSVSDLASAIMDYGETASFGKLLKMYSKNVIEYILSHVTKRFEMELREEMLKD